MELILRHFPIQYLPRQYPYIVQVMQLFRAKKQSIICNEVGITYSIFMKKIETCVFKNSSGVQPLFCYVDLEIELLFAISNEQLFRVDHFRF